MSLADPLYKRYAVTEPLCSHCLYAYGFRIYFTPFTRVLFAFPSRYWFTIGQSGVFSLGGWSPHLQSGYLVSRPTLFHNNRILNTGLSPSMADLSRSFFYSSYHFWANPRSLAATRGISVDFSSYGYLDVSVPHVRFFEPIYSAQDTSPKKGGFPHSDISGSSLVCQLPETFRRLPRPSSPLTAKASTVCAWSLDYITPNSLCYIHLFNHSLNHGRIQQHNKPYTESTAV